MKKMNLREKRIVSYEHKQKLPSEYPRSKGGAHEHMRMWTVEEEQYADALRCELGDKWTTIARIMTDGGFERNASSVRNHFHRKKPSVWDSYRIRKNKCRVCGLPKRGHMCLGVPITEEAWDAAVAVAEATPAPEPKEPLMLTLSTPIPEPQATQPPAVNEFVHASTSAFAAYRPVECE